MTATPEHLQSALNYCVDFARLMLAKRGKSYPFGATINRLGGLEAKGGWIGEEHPDAHQLFEFLLSKLRVAMSDGEAIAIAVTVNVNIPPEYEAPFPDGVRVLLESAGYSRFIYYPYKIEHSGDPNAEHVISFAEAFAVGVAL